MPWPPKQWRAITASTIRRYGREEGEKRLRRYKNEAQARKGGKALRDAARSRRNR